LTVGCSASGFGTPDARGSDSGFGNVAFDGGVSSDGGFAADAGKEKDAGISTDAGEPSDAGPREDGGTTDGGALRDAGETADSGASDDAGGKDAGPGLDTDAGAPPPDAGVCSAGSTTGCQTSCGTAGTETCANGAWGACAPPQEICNLTDDDCNGSCDDLLGCRLAVDRSYDSTNGLHFLTTSDSEASCCGYSVETYGDFYLYAAQQTGLVPLYRCRTTAGAHLYTTDPSCAGNTLEGPMGWAGTDAVCGSVPLYGLHNPASGDYLYTLNPAEVSAAEAGGYVSLGVTAYVWPADCGGSNCAWPSPIAMVGATLPTVTGFPTAWYGFPIDGTQSFSSLSGTVSIQQVDNLYSEVLFILQYLPSGACPSGRWPSSTPEFGPPGAVGIGQFIVKGPTSGTFTLPIDFTLPGGLPISHCVLLGLNGGAVSTPHPVTVSADLSLSYSPPRQPAQSIIGLGGEFCFGQNWGCQAATTDDALSFAAVQPISQDTKLVALYGDISDTTFDGTSNFGAPPSGAWTGENAFYVYHGAECSLFGVTAGLAGPGNYFAEIPADATLLLSVPLSGSGIGVSTQQVYQGFPGTPLQAGDCFVTLWGLQGGGGFDNETQVDALVAP
jgi:hypothetical protein